jgi:hypothetical protein
MMLISLLISFLLGLSLACAILLPSGEGVQDYHFPDFWNAECR